MLGSPHAQRPPPGGFVQVRLWEVVGRWWAGSRQARQSARGFQDETSVDAVDRNIPAAGVYDHSCYAAVAIRFKGKSIIRNLGEEVLLTFRKEILFGFVVFLYGQMIAFAPDDEDEIWRLSVAPNVFLEDFGRDTHFGVLLERGARRELVIRGKTLPHDRSECVLEQALQEGLVNAFAVAAVGHDEDARALLVEANGVVPPAIVMPFLEKRLAKGRPVETPSQAIAEADRLVFAGRFVLQGGELVF